MIPKKLINESASQFGLRCDRLNQTLEKQADCVFGYKEGVQFAEEYLKDLSIEFVEWIFNNDIFDDFAQAKKSSRELFEIFIKERNDEKV